MDVSPFLASDWWKRVALAMVLDVLKREKGRHFGDPADDEELYEKLLMALYPADGRDNELIDSLPDE